LCLLKLKLESISKPDQLLLADNELIRINPNLPIRLDVDDFEKAFASARGIHGRDLSGEQALALAEAVALHQGTLIEGCYEDWCLCERERLLDMNLTMLEKLIGYCEAQGEYEQGMSYGDSLLRYDSAHECAHRAMMRLKYKSGDRTGALRQYQRCEKALMSELGVEPSSRTKELNEKIRNDESLELF
jgi:DNA-binding SARP family transcriptional activator